jgi:hypothetical protein
MFSRRKALSKNLNDHSLKAEATPSHKSSIFHWDSVSLIGGIKDHPHQVFIDC